MIAASCVDAPADPPVDPPLNASATFWPLESYTAQQRLVTTFWGKLSIDRSNKFGIGVYHDGASGGLPVASQLPWALNLTGHGGRVLLYVALLFSQNGNVSSCTGGCISTVRLSEGDNSSCSAGCVPPAQFVASLQQAYAMGLHPVVRLGQWPRTIRDFSDDTEHLHYTSLAKIYRDFAAALPLPPDGSPLEVIVHNELNTKGEWVCSGDGYASTNDTAAEVAGCLRDTMGALRPLPRLLLSLAPTAYTAPAIYPCKANTSGVPSPVNYSTPTDIEFMVQMRHTVPDLYGRADFFNSHPYPWGDRPFSTKLGRAGVVHYRTQLEATGYPSLPVLISETGWKGHDEVDKAVSIVAALQEEWLPDARVASVMPFLLSSEDGSGFANSGWRWVLWPNSTIATPPSATQQYNATRALRCKLHASSACGP